MVVEAKVESVDIVRNGRILNISEGRTIIMPLDVVRKKVDPSFFL